MPPSQGMSCEPVFSGDDAFAPNGEIQLQVTQTGGNSNRNATYEGAENDYAYDAATDQYHFVGVSDDQMSVDVNSSQFNEEAYLNALVESDPVISEAIQWGAKNMPPEIVEEYNRVVENTDDLDEIHRAVNFMVDNYRAAQVQVEAEAEQFSQPEESEVAEAPESEDISEQLEAALQDAAVRGDEVLADILEHMSYVNSGEMTQSEVNQVLLSRYDMEVLQEAFARY